MSIDECNIMNTVKTCSEHSGHEARITANEKAIETLFKQINNIKYWVIAGMGSMLLSGLVFVLEHLPNIHF